MTFSNRLIQWYLENKRDLPWRNTTNPYPIWLSEIILQQTRVAQGLPYYERFIETFPTVFDLANASEEQVLKLWQGLGYYSRGRNLHKTAQIIAFELNGTFPTTYTELLKLKGIGSYTAATIASFSQKEVVPVVDGNVFRILARYFDVETDISSATAKKEFTALANELIDSKQPDVFNQALMEFGALQCVPKNPNCSICVFKDSCAALQKKKVDLLPIKLKKRK
nr:A/G-specific adenine glycosylase [Flavobacterium piscinae]